METKNIKKLTDREIRNLKCNERLVDNGLRIEKGKTGVPSFIYRYRQPKSNRIKQVKLGTYPEMSLLDAQVQLELLRSKRDSGIDPREFLLRQQAAESTDLTQDSMSFTVSDMIELYLTEKIEDRIDGNGKRINGSRNLKGQRETRRTLEKDVLAHLSSQDASKLNLQGIRELIMGIVNRGAPVQAGNVLRELYLAYEYAIGVGRFNDDFTNPALKAKNALKSAGIKLTNGKRTRAFSDDELEIFLRWLPASKVSKTVKALFQFTLWTGCRTGELCGARWEHVDFERKTLHLPQTKTGVSRDVQLPTQAIDWLEQAKHQKGDYLFQSQKSDKGITQNHLTSQTYSLRKTGDMLDIDAWSPHDLRRTVRTGLARLKVREEVAEAVLGHAKKGIAGTYNLYQYEDECREALQLWANHMDRLLTRTPALKIA